jgi:hypothetical protein
MNTRPISHSLFRNGVAAIVAGLLLGPGAAQAAPKAWNCTNSYWDIISCWSPAGVPVLADDVTAGPVSATNTFLRFDDITGTRSANSLLINSGTANTISFLQTGGSLTITNAETVGSTGTGSYALSAGSNNVMGILRLGDSAGSNGTYNLSGTGSLNAGNNESIGEYGTGTVTQSGGTNTVSNTLYLGVFSGSNGTYNLSGTGSLSVAGYEYIGGYIAPSGTGTFIQSGGTHTVSGPLVLGLGIGGNGTYNLSGTGSLIAGSESIGVQGTGSFTQSGGTHTVSNILSLGGYTGSFNSGTYTLSGTGSLSVLGDERIGDESTGRFNQSGGTHTVSSLYLGYYSLVSNGTYNLSGTGSLTANNEYIGSSGTGSFGQSGGTHTVSNTLYLGSSTGSNGTYALSGTGSLTANNEYIGSSGTGSFTQFGGTHTVNSDLSLGVNSGSSGTYTLAGGTLNVTGNFVNGAGTSTLTIDGGTLNVSGSSIDVDIFVVGSSSNGSYTLGSGKTLTAVGEVIGDHGTGSFTQSGGTHTVSNALYLGGSTGGNGTYTLSSTGSLTVDHEYVGLVGTGSFTQSGGTHTVSNSLYLGVVGGSSGTYTLSGGTLNVTGNIVNGAGNGSFNLDGGTLNVTGSSIDVDIFRVGNAAGSNGSYTLGSGKTLTAVGEVIGSSGTGSFTQSGGTHTVSSSLVLGNNSTGKGSYALSGTGSLTANTETIGSSGTGSFTQSGGTHTVGGLYLGDSFFTGTGTGSYSLSGTGSLSAANEIIGNNFGTGTFTQSGGTHTVSNNLYLGTGGLFATGSGSYDLSGNGSLTAGTEYIGYSGIGNFTQSGGTHTVSGTMTLAASLGGSGTYNLSGGKLRAANIAVNPGGAFNFNGGMLAVGHFIGNLTNNGGTLTPGDSPGVTNVTGDYTQSPTGIFAVEIGGLLAGTEHDVLNVSGTATLGGTLNVSLIDLGSGHFTPHLGDSFDILSADQLQGSFSSLTLAALDPSLRWDIGYLTDAIGTTDVVRLSVDAVPVPPAVWLFGSGLLGLVGIARRKVRPTRTAHRHAKAGHAAGVTRRTYMSE